MLSETRRKSPGKRPAGGQRTCCWAAKGAGRRLGAAYCLLGCQGRRETFRGSLTLLSETRRKSPGKRPAGGQRTCCWAAKGAGRRLGAAYCLTLLSETGRKSPGKRPAGGQRTCCWAAKGAGRRLGAACCLTLLSETRRKSPGKRPAGGQRTCCWAAKGAGRRLGAAYCLLGCQGRRETFRGSLLPNVAF